MVPAVNGSLNLETPIMPDKRLLWGDCLPTSMGTLASHTGEQQHHWRELDEERQRYQMEIAQPSHLPRSLIKGRCDGLTERLDHWTRELTQPHQHQGRPKPEVYFWRLRLAGFAMITRWRISSTMRIATECAEIASLKKLPRIATTKAGVPLGPLSVVFTHDATTDMSLGYGPLPSARRNDSNKTGQIGLLPAATGRIRDFAP